MVIRTRAVVVKRRGGRGEGGLAKSEGKRFVQEEK